VRATATDAYLLTNNIILLIDSYRQNPTDIKLLALQEELAKIDPITEMFTVKMYELNDRVTKMLIMVMSILVLLLIAFATFISVLISRSIATPITRLVDNFKEIASGNLKSSVRIESNNEIGDLSRAFLEIQTGLQNIVAHSKKVAQGDYSNNLVPKSESDE
jgi:nitrogen fixation/metabolism regulation signal transduction histidine kinase